LQSAVDVASLSGGTQFVGNRNATKEWWYCRTQKWKQLAITWTRDLYAAV